MYQRAHFIKNNALQFPVAYLVGIDQITIRTFTESEDPQGLADLADTKAFLATHDEAFVLRLDTKPVSPAIHGEVFGAEFADRTYRMVDSFGMTRSTEGLGVSANTDAAVFMVCVTDTGLIKVPFNRTATTMQQRLGKYTMYRDLHMNSVMTLAVDFADQPWSESQLFLRHNPAFGASLVLDATAQGTEFTLWEINEPMTYDSLPTVKIEANEQTVSPGGTVTFTVSTVSGDTGELLASNSTIYLEAVAGYLPQTRVTLQDGIGEVRAMALGLVSGESVRVKAGFRFMPGLGDATVDVA